MRKIAMVRAVDLRPKRRAAGYTADASAEILDVSDGKHVCAIETGTCAITIGNALRLPPSMNMTPSCASGVTRPTARVTDEVERKSVTSRWLNI